MAQKKQPVQFRMPWFTGAPNLLPAFESLTPRPKDRSKSPARPDTTVPIQRPPGVAPVQSPPAQAKGAPRAEQQQASGPPQPATLSVAMDSSATSQSESSSRSTNQTQVNTSQPSPPRTAQTQGSLLSPSPSRTSSQSGASVPSSPVPKTQLASQSQFPSHLAPETTSEVSKPIGTQPATSAYQQEETIAPPPRTTIIQVASLSPAPSRTGLDSGAPLSSSPTQATSQPQSPSHLPTEGTNEVLEPTAESAQPASSAYQQEENTASPPRATIIQVASLSPSLSRTGPDSGTPALSSYPTPATLQPRSPSHLPTEGTNEVPEPSTRLASSASQQEKEKMAPSEQFSPESEPKIKSPLKPIPGSQQHTQPERTSTLPAGMSGDKKESSPTSPATSQPRSPSHLPTEGTNEVLEPTAEKSTRLASSASQPEKEKMALSEPFSPESEPKTPLKPIAGSQEHTQPERMSTLPAGTSGDKKESSPTSPVTLKTPPAFKKLEPESTSGNSMSPSKTGSKLHQSEEEKEKVVQEPIKDGKAEDSRKKRSIRQTTAELHTKATASGTKGKEPFTKTFRADKKQQKARETVGRKMMFAASNPSGKDIKVVSSRDPVTINLSSISPPKSLLSNVEQAPLQKGIREDISKFVHILAAEHPTQPMDDRALSVITLAGDNRGATMHVGCESARNEGSMYMHRAYKTNPEESPEETSDGEENSKKGSCNPMDEDEVGMAYVNSNIQSINNSLMFHGSITE